MRQRDILFRLKTIMESYLGIFTSFIKNIKNRKTILIAIFSATACLYFMSSYLLPAHRHFHISQTQERKQVDQCLVPYFQKWQYLIQSNNAVLKETPGSTKENRFFPFTGNGFVGFSADDGWVLFVLSEDEYFQLPFTPVLEVKFKENALKKRRVTMLNIKYGLLQVVTSYTVGNQCVLVKETMIAHRTLKEVAVHEIEVTNNGLLPITVLLALRLDLKIVKLAAHKEGGKDGGRRYNVITGKFLSPNNKQIHVASALSEFQSSMNVPQKSRNKISLASVVAYEFETNMNKPKAKRTKKSIESYDKRIEERLTQQVAVKLLKLEQMKIDFALKEHISAWSDIWKTGVSIYSDNDPDSPTPLHVNLTNYYFYSNVLYNITKKDLPKIGCFYGAPTMTNADLWVIPTSLSSLSKQKRKWLDELSKSCFDKSNYNFLSIQEYMTLAFLGFRYTSNHLELALNPSNLHSNASIRNVGLGQFASNGIFSLDIIVDDQDTFISINYIGGVNPLIYGCAAACEYIVELTNSDQSKKFVIHNTNPVTPIFYISTNKTHLISIRESPFIIHAKNNGLVSRQKAIEIHHFKLSPKFWIAVIVLVVSFHIIILKMIYNECRKERSVSRRRGVFDS